MPREGVFARVLRGGTIHVGDDMQCIARTQPFAFQAAVITLSDAGAAGTRKDKSGPMIAQRLRESGYTVIEQLLLPDGRERLEHELIRLCDQRQPDLILTTGGTGFSQRDVTPEATLAVADRQVPGIAEAMRAASMQITKRATLAVATRLAPGIAEAIRAESLKITKHAMLSRGASVIRGKTLIINLPGSPKACMETMDVFMDTIPHGLGLLRGTVHDCARA